MGGMPNGHVRRILVTFLDYLRTPTCESCGGTHTDRTRWIRTNDQKARRVKKDGSPVTRWCHGHPEAPRAP